MEVKIIDITENGYGIAKVENIDENGKKKMVVYFVEGGIYRRSCRNKR